MTRGQLARRIVIIAGASLIAGSLAASTGCACMNGACGKPGGTAAATTASPSKSGSATKKLSLTPSLDSAKVSFDDHGT